MYPTPSASPVGSTHGLLESGNYQNVDIGHRPSDVIEAIRDPPKATTTGSETFDQVTSLARWEAGQRLDRGYFRKKEEMIKKLEAITACLDREPQVGGPVQPANGPPTTGEPMTLDTLNSMDDYGYRLRNFIAADPLHSPGLLGISVGEVCTWPEYVPEVPSGSGLGTGETRKEQEQGGKPDEGYGDRKWEGVAGAPSCG